jgi:hypothetical protein
MAAVTAGASAAADLSLSGPVPARTDGPAAAGWSRRWSGRTGAVRSWPLLVLAAPAAAEVWSGWVGIAQKTGFGLVSPLPGIWPSLHLDTAITLPVGVEAYAAYALCAWLTQGQVISARTRRVRQVVCDRLVRSRHGRAGRLSPAGPGRGGAGAVAVTTIVSCLPVLVLAMGTTLAHMLRADTGTAADPPGNRAPGPAVPRSSAWSCEDRAGLAQGQSAPRAPLVAPGPSGTRAAPQDRDARAAAPGLSGIGQAHQAACRLTAAGKPVSRRTLHSQGNQGSNQALNALAGMINAELAGTAALPARPGDAVALS